MKRVPVIVLMNSVLHRSGKEMQNGTRFLFLYGCILYDFVSFIYFIIRCVSLLFFFQFGREGGGLYSHTIHQNLK